MADPVMSASHVQPGGVHPPSLVASHSHTNQPQVGIDELVRAAGPLATAYFESQERMQQRQLEYDTKVVLEGSKRHRALIAAALVFSVALLSLAGFLLYQGRDTAAIDLIKLIVTIAGVGFGGYGVAAGRRRAADTDE